MLYDGLLMLALLFLATLPFVAVHGGEAVPAGSLGYRLAMLGATWLFFAGFWSRFGRTLGMQSWGLSIESVRGGRPDLVEASLRFFYALLSWLPAGAGYWWQLIDRDGLSWHDRASGTRLYYTPKKAR